MTEIPITILIFVLGFITVILTMGYIFRTKFPISMLLFFSGSIFLFLFVTTDNIQALGLDTTESFDYTLSYPMNVTTSTTSAILDNTNFGSAEKIVNTNSALYNKPISCIRVDLSKTGSPTGTATIGILGDDSQIVKTFGTLDATTLLTTQKSYQFCLSNHDYWIISLYDRVGIFYNSGSAGNSVNVFYSNVNPFDSTDSIRNRLTSGGLWVDHTTDDLRMILINEELTINNQEEPYPIRNPVTFEPTFIGISLILMSLCLIVLGGLVETGKFN